MNKTEPQFTRRLVVLEKPAVVAAVAQRAEERGHSLGAEVREALRHWLTQDQPEPESRTGG